ncbi:hypothetical protein [Mucilaginibacter lappiensis]|uniref:hypothetical protein n=1 Tax=Mucilaginibacter lappiensis TaxID=354630 RepID=UPI003D1909A6
MDDSLPKVTYLFGAGASAQALPTIKGLPERIKVVRQFVENNYIFENDEVLTVNSLQFKKNDAKNYLLEGLDKLYTYSQNHSTVDTYAKKLHITSRSSEVNELCFFLALYFNIEQKIVGLDPRYDTFLVSILNSNSYKFPANVKFLTWNYDLQMEIAHEKINNRGSFDVSFDLFNTELRDFERNKFISLKINGSCNFKGKFDRVYPVVTNILDPECKSDDLDFALSFGYSQVKLKNRFYDGNININFAWYSNHSNEALEFFNDTGVLVVIGYSFPFFNREVDRKIIRPMTNLKKIYIQDCNPEDIKSRFLSILPDWQKIGIEIIPVSNISEFFLPPEL